MSKVYVYDRRQFPYFQVDNALIEVYGAHLGAYAIAVYNCLACHANRDMIAFPSYERIGKETGTSRSTAMRAIKKLIEWNIIQLIEEDRHRAGTKEYENNRYLLNPQSEWKTVPVLTETGGVTETPRSPQVSGSVRETPQVVSERTRGGVPQTHKQEPVQQEPKNKNQQQHAVDSSKSVSSVEQHSPEYQELSERLVKLRVFPDRVPYLIERFSDNVRAALGWWETHPDDVAKARSLGAAVASSITDPHKFPQVYAAPEPSPAAQKSPSRPTKSEEREKYRAVYESVWNGLAAPLREALGREGKDMFEYVEKYEPDALALAIRQVEERQ